MTKKVYQALTKRSENALNRLSKLMREKEEADVKRSCAQVDRIIDWNYVAQQMHCEFCKEGMHMENIEDETVNGLASIFRIRCQQCLLVNTIKSGKEYTNPSSEKPIFSINTKLALGKNICQLTLA